MTKEFQRDLIPLTSFLKSISEIDSNSSTISSSIFSILSSRVSLSNNMMLIFLSDDKIIIIEVIMKKILGFENNIIMGKIKSNNNIIKTLSNCINFHL
jgi:hypothetical protein